MAIVSVLIACGGSTEQTTSGTQTGTIPSGAGPVSQDNLAHEMAIAMCNLVERCAANADILGSFGGSNCLGVFEKRYADQSIPQLNAAIVAGHMSYDPSAVRTCLDAYARLNCDYSNVVDVLSACANAFQGNLAIGAECNSNYECAESLDSTFCASDGTCPGHCQARGAIGRTCDYESQCEAALDCDSASSTCQPRLKSGELCGDSTTAAGVCGGFFACRQQSTSALHTCTNAFASGSLTEGQICDISNACAAGLVCQASAESSDASTSMPLMRCQKEASTGGACRYSYGNPCPDGQFCPVAYSDASTTGAQCTNQVPANQACTGQYAYECQGEATCSSVGICTPMQRLGGACTSGSNCYSDVCTNGACVTPRDCER